MKILLINAMNRLSKTTQRPPLGLGYIASVLIERGFDNVDVIDYNTTENDEQANELIRKSSADVVGISFMTMSLDIGIKVAKMVKENNRDTVVIVGGPHSTVMPEETLKDENIDIVVVGEGEYIFLDLVKSIDSNNDLSNVKGIFYKTKDGIKKTESSEFISNLDELPFPAMDLLPMDYYLSLIPQYPVIPPDLHIICIRGCPFNCQYCQPTARKLFGRKTRYRSPKNIVDEMEAIIKKYKVNTITLTGDTFTARKKWVHEFCREIKQRGVNIPLVIGTRVDCLDKETIKRLKDIGVYFIQFGVESGSPRILEDIMDKRITIEQVKKTFKLCNDAGIITSANFMFGSPTETKKDILMSYNLLKEIDADYVASFITNPIPGTYLYDFAKEKNLILTDDFSKISRHSIGTMKRELSDETIEKYLKLFWYETYKNRTINILRPWRKPHLWKYSLKRDFAKLKISPSDFIKDVLIRPITVLAIIKYHLFQKRKVLDELQKADL